MGQTSDRSEIESQTEAVNGGSDPVTLQVLLAEYGLLQSSLGLAWGLTQQRTSVLLGVLSAVAVAIGLVAQATGFGPDFAAFSAVVLGIGLFVGLATFVRVVHAAREATVLILGMNRIRRFLRDVAPGSSAYFVLPVNDDEAALYRGLGTGMPGHAPKAVLVYALVQIPGVVSVVNSAVAASLTVVVAGALGVGPVLAFLGALAFAGVLALSLVYWQRSIDDLRRSWIPRFPSPPPG